MSKKKGGKLKCVMTGSDTEKFDVNKAISSELNEYIIEIRDILIQNEILYDKLICMGNLDKNQYLNVLSKAKFIIHPGFADNGNGAAIDAAFLGVPTISSDYPAMRYIDEKMSLNFRFYETFESDELSSLILESENDCSVWKKNIPDIDYINKFSIENTYREVYDTVKNTVQF